MWRFFKYFLLSLLGILLLGIGFAWWLIEDGAWIRAKTEQIVTDISGRPFAIGGELDLDVSLNPGVVLNDLRLANAPWADGPDMARVERLAVSINLMSVFSDQLVIHFIEADGVALMLAENEAGDANWELFSEKSETEKAPLEELPFILERLKALSFRPPIGQSQVP